jgi:viroplasmin and RNaseH domain-containing protein
MTLVLTNARPAAELQVSGFPGARHKAYDSMEAAYAAWDHALANNTFGPPSDHPPAHISGSSPLSDEEVYWVVSIGAYPGVYYGR